MRIALIADAFPPMRTSAAVQMRDLSVEMVAQGHTAVMLIPAPHQAESWRVEDFNGVTVVRLKTPPTKDISYVRRTVNELLLPFFMLHNLKKSPYATERWDGIVWYSPSIFLAPLAHALKRTSRCKSYLIIRDIFPEWALDMGLLKPGLVYRFFKKIANYQYSVANIIGVQSEGNLAYFNTAKHGRSRVEVLQNWLSKPIAIPSSISIDTTPLAGRKIFVYAGNMGVAQGMNILVDLAEHLQHRNDIGFIFVGRGSDVLRLQREVQTRGLDNVLFHDEVDPSEIPALYAQCHIGLVALDPRHNTHNIPGKFLSYIEAGLPVLASVNPDNDLVELIRQEAVGRACTNQSVVTLKSMALELTDNASLRGELSPRCRALASRLFSSSTAVKQIVSALQKSTDSA